jgi:hypothetical protein
MAKARPTKTERTLPPLVVRYPRRMRPQKPYVVQVSWQSREKSKLGSSEPYSVRLIMAGAQVLPSERQMDPAKPTNRAVFYVTPLARRGWLKGERLEVLREGAKVQEIALPAKVATQRKTWLLLLLAVLIPWFLITHVQLSEDEYLDQYKGASKKPWRTVLQGLETNTPIMTEEVTQGVNEFCESINLPEAYLWVHRVVTRDEVFTNDGIYAAHLPFWIGVAFLGLALLSWFTHREKFKYATGKPLPAGNED